MRTRIGLVGAAVASTAVLIVGDASTTAVASRDPAQSVDTPATCRPERTTVPPEHPEDTHAVWLGRFLTSLANSFTADAVYDFGDNGKFYLVVDPGRHPDIAAKLRDALATRGLPVPVTVIESCVSQERLHAVRRQILAMVPEGLPSMTTELHEPGGKVWVMVSDASFAKKLRATFGSLVYVSVGKIYLTASA